MIPPARPTNTDRHGPTRTTTDDKEIERGSCRSFFPVSLFVRVSPCSLFSLALKLHLPRLHGNALSRPRRRRRRRRSERAGRGGDPGAGGVLGSARRGARHRRRSGPVGRADPAGIPPRHLLGHLPSRRGLALLPAPPPGALRPPLDPDAARPGASVRRRIGGRPVPGLGGDGGELRGAGGRPRLAAALRAFRPLLVGPGGCRSGPPAHPAAASVPPGPLRAAGVAVRHRRGVPLTRLPRPGALRRPRGTLVPPS